MEETHLKVVTLFVDDTLNLIVEVIRFYDHVIFKNDRILETLVKTPLIKFHVSKETTDGTHVKICDVRAFYTGIVVHLDSLLKIFWFNLIFIFVHNLHTSRIRTINNFQWNIFFVTLDKSFVPLLLIFHRE